MQKKFFCIRPSHELNELQVFPVFEKDGEFFTFGKPSRSFSIIENEFEEPFVLFNPEYAVCPDFSKKYPVLVGDWNLNFFVVLQNIERFSLIFIDGVGAELLGGKVPVKVVGVPVFALYSDVFVNDDPVFLLRKKNIDVLFLGNLNPGIHERRNRLLKKILNLPENYKVVVGCGLYDRRLYSLALSRSKIVFNRSVRKEMNMRVFEALRSASLLFLEDDNIESWRYIKKFEDAIPYTEENLCELIEFYLRNDDEREKVAISGYRAIGKVNKSMVYEIMWKEIKEQETMNRNSDIFSKIAYLRSLINHLFNFPVCISDDNIKYIEQLAFSLMEGSDNFIKASLLSDLSFLYTFSALKRKDRQKEFVEKALRYINSAIAFEPLSLLYWYNFTFLSYSVGALGDFTKGCSNFFKILKDVPLERSLKEIRGWPKPFSPFIFSHYTFFKSHIDSVWVENFENTAILREEISKTLAVQIYVFLSNFSLEKGDLKEAEEFCYQALKIFPESSQLYYLLGKIKMRGGDFATASAAYLKGYELDPFFFEKWPEILISLALSGQKDKFHEVLNEMKKMSQRIYFHNGNSFEFSVGDTSHKIRIKSINDLINEYLI